MLVLQVFDETPFPVYLEGTVHTTVVVVFMLHLLVLLEVAFLSGRVGAEIAVVSYSLMYTPCMAQKTSLVWSPVVAKVAGKSNTLVYG
jgi:hypothetical protein